jgi:hypothetical protein
MLQLIAAPRGAHRGTRTLVTNLLQIPHERCPTRAAPGDILTGEG